MPEDANGGRMPVFEKDARLFPKTWGAEFIREGAARFRLWAPALSSLQIELNGDIYPMGAAGDGWYEFLAEGIFPDARYRFVLPDGQRVPDPAARAQEGGVEGASILVDPTDYAWKNTDWAGRPWEEAVFYELHIGTFTQEGTFRAALAKLDYLQSLGVTAIEIMPVGQFPGVRGWGYDGVLPYAPQASYGTPSDLKALVDGAHTRSMMVFLDVVYNHFGPVGNYLPAYAPSFFDPDQMTPWGAVIDYSREAVRRFAYENALYWLEEYNFDGLRLDAVEQIRDPHSDIHILNEISRRVHDYFDRPRYLVVEDHFNRAHLLKTDEESGKRIYHGSWNDDFHHVAHVIASGEVEGNYEGFDASPGGLLATALSEGFIRQGQPFAGKPEMQHGEPSADMPPVSFVNFIQNHDQIGNRPFGDRIGAYSPPEKVKLLTAILCLSPGIPLFFMGDETQATTPFQFFCDLPSLASAIVEGRFSETRNFGPLPEPEMKAQDLPDPNDIGTFLRSKFDWTHAESASGLEAASYLKSLLEIRERHVVPGLKGASGNAGQVISASDHALAVDWQLADRELQLRANVSDEIETLPGVAGDIIFRMGEVDAEDNGCTLKGMSLAVAVRRGQD